MTAAVAGSTLWCADIDDAVVALDEAPDGRIAVAGAEGSLTLLSVDGVLIRRQQISAGCLAVSWSPAGDRMAVGSVDGVAILDQDGAALSRRRGGWCAALAWSFDGARLAAGVGRSTVVLTADGAELVSRDRSSTVTAVDWINRRVASAAYGGVHVQHVSPGAAEDILPFTGSLLAMAISPDRRWAASGNQDATLHVWRVGKRGEELQMSGYPTKITTLGFSPDSRLLASGGGTNVTVWSFAGAGPRGSTPRILAAHDETVAALAWSRDGRYLAAVADDGRLAVWEPAAAIPGRAHAAVDALRRDSPAASVRWDRRGRILAGWSDGVVLARAL
ncbi:WD40 repeat domain-containing protein [Mycobacterium sp. smrl_JER01]|uniref:WD40 repeat domain-containing protein n=1 Tax=Mycobacterium sp. smrl_JER01 TaxID=3402633 RepID=UPI003ABEDD5C